MKKTKSSNRIVDLLENYEQRDFFYERAKTWEESPLQINELMA